VGEAAALLAAGLVGLTAVSGGAFAAPERLAAGLVAALACAAAVLAVRDPLRGEERLTLLWVAWAAAVAAVVGLAPLAAKQSLGAWLVAWLLWLAARRATPRARRMACAILAASAALLALGVVLEWWGLGVPRAGGLVENPNVVAALLVPAVVLVWPVGRRSRAVPAAILVVLLLAAVVVTGSRAALVAVAVAGIFAVPRGRMRAVVVVVVGVAVAAVIGWRLTVQHDVLAWHRPAIWRAVAGVVAERPVTGFGPGAWADVAGRARITYPDDLARHELVPGYAESSLLAVAAQTGLVGLALVVAAAAAWWWGAGKGDDPGRRRRRALGLAILTVALLHDMLQVDVVLWWWALVVGLADPPQAPGRPASRWGRLVAAAAVIWAVTWSIAEPALARVRWQRAPQPSTEAVWRAVRTEPWDDRPARQRAAVLLGGPEWGWLEAGEALSWSERSVRVHPGSSADWTTLGRALTRTLESLGRWPGTLERAREAFGRATDLEPRLPWAWLEWARLERAAGHLQIARARAERAVEVEPAFVRGWLFLARVELDLGRVTAARSAYAHAIHPTAVHPRRPLTPYEKELLEAPGWQMDSLEAVLR